MAAFDPKDFAENPGKYRLFKTAVVVRDIATNSRNDFPVGTVVGLEHYYDRPNIALPGSPVQPIYWVTSAEGKKTALFAEALGDFVL